MIKNIVFDMGNVLIRYSARDYVREYVKDEKLGDELCDEIFRSAEWIQLDRGSITEEDAIRAFQKRIPQEHHHYVLDLVENWHSAIPPYPEMEQLIKELKEKGYHIYLLSNTSIRFHQFRVNIPALQYFDGEFISADYHMLKPEICIYQTFLQHFLLNPSECFFVDDNSANMEAAYRVGMKGAIYYGDIEKLRKRMKEEMIRV